MIPHKVTCPYCGYVYIKTCTNVCPNCYNKGNRGFPGPRFPQRYPSPFF